MGGVVAYFYTRRSVIAIRSPGNRALFSERNSRFTKRIPLSFGWRITIRPRIGHQEPHP